MTTWYGPNSGSGLDVSAMVLHALASVAELPGAATSSHRFASSTRLSRASSKRPSASCSVARLSMEAPAPANMFIRSCGRLAQCDLERPSLRFSCRW
jgi:hypothetical protein